MGIPPTFLSLSFIPSACPELQSGQADHFHLSAVPVNIIFALFDSLPWDIKGWFYAGSTSTESTCFMPLTGQLSHNPLVILTHLNMNIIIFQEMGTRTWIQFPSKLKYMLKSSSNINSIDVATVHALMSTNIFEFLLHV